MRCVTSVDYSWVEEMLRQKIPLGYIEICATHLADAN